MVWTAGARRAVAPGVCATGPTEPFVKCYFAILLGVIASPEEERGRNGNIKMGMILLCSLLRLMVKWSQG